VPRAELLAESFAQFEQTTSEEILLFRRVNEFLPSLSCETHHLSAKRIAAGMHCRWSTIQLREVMGFARALPILRIALQHGARLFSDCIINEIAALRRTLQAVPHSFF
jgi:hypothetical protein